MCAGGGNGNCIFTAGKCGNTPIMDEIEGRGLNPSTAPISASPRLSSRGCRLKRASKTDPSRGAEKTGTTLPTPRVEPVKLSTRREFEIKFKTDAAGLKLALRSDLLAADAANAPRRTLQSVYFDTPAGDLQSNASSGAKGA